MTDRKFDVYNTILAEMKERNMISPFLYEGLRDDDFGEIIEESKDRPIRYATGTGDDRIFWFYGTKVSEARFIEGWSDLITYPKHLDTASFIRDVIGADLAEIPAQTSQGHDPNLDAISALIRAINKQRKAEGITETVPFKGDRERVYGSMSTAEDDNRATLPQSRNSRATKRTPEQTINYRGQRDPRIERINSQELTPGEFYTDVSRIPPRAYSLFQKLSGQLRSVPPEKLSFGSRWEKSFVYGYAPTLAGTRGTFVYEVWYNSIDSTFSLHDGHGNDVTNYRYPTLMEVTRALFNAIVSKSSGDDAYSKDSPQFQSVLRSVGSAMDSHVKNMVDREKSERTNMKRKLDSYLSEFINNKSKEVFHQMYPDGFVDPEEKLELAGKYAELFSEIKQEAMAGNISQKSVDEIVNNMGKTEYFEFADFDRMAYRIMGNAKKEHEGRRHQNKPSNVPKPVKEPESEPERVSRDAVNYHVEFNNLVNQVSAQGDYVSKFTRAFEQTKNDSMATDLLVGFVGQFIEYEKERVKQTVEYNKAPNPINKVIKSESNILKTEVKDILTNQPLTSDHFRKIAAAMNDMVTTVGREVATIATKADQVGKKRAKVTESDNPFLKLRDEILEEQVKEEQDFLNQFFDSEEDAKNHRRYLTSRGHTPNGIGEIRQQAEMSGKTQRAIMDAISNDLLSVYYETRARDLSWFERVASKGWITKYLPTLPRLLRGRAAPIESPLLKGLFKSPLYHASFVQGYDLRGGPDLEIWYITEPSKAGFGSTRVISSFYIYDVKAQKIVRRYIPYVRHAVQEVNKKISFVTGPGLG